MLAVSTPTPRTAAASAVFPRTWAVRRVLPLLASAVTAAVTVAACSSWSSMTGGAAPEPAAATPTASSDGSFTSRVKSFFSGDSGKLSSPAASGETVCPGVEYRQGAATWAVNGSAAENAALSLKYQVSFLQTARECIVADGNVTIKVGVQGRIVVGPAGGSGTLNIPLRYALVREGVQRKTLWTRLFTVPVSIEPGQLNLTWLHVEEEMTVPRWSSQDSEALVIYVGFDPDGGSARPKPAAKPKTARVR
jgi:hypothetical protein